MPRFHCRVRNGSDRKGVWSRFGYRNGAVTRMGPDRGPLDNIVAGVAWLRQNAGLLRGKVVEPAVRNMDPKEQQELLERIQDTDEEEKYPLLFTFDFQEDMEEVFHNMAAEEDLRVNAMFLGRWVDSQ
ncbi:unnamed protein product [Boreogadus saida]